MEAMFSNSALTWRTKMVMFGRVVVVVGQLLLEKREEQIVG